MAAVRPLVAVQGIDGEATEQVTLPAVFQAPIRSDVVHIVHTGLNKNHRQAYAVSSKAGHQTAAESWGTGRAVSRIPRVPGGGTHRAGQAAFGNMTRGGHMFAPTKVWRRWHRKIALNQKRYAVVSAVAATAVPALVQARGHKIDAVPEVPLVISDAVESVTKTKQAVAILAAVGAADDVERAAKSRRIRSGKGKLRNRRHVQRVGPLVVYANDDGITRAFRNVPGVELAHVERLNLLRLAPGGHLGRFVIWTKSAFEALDRVFGDGETPAQGKKGYRLPRPIVANGDLSRLIQSDEVQSVVRAPRAGPRRAVLKKNPLRNLGARIRLNPHAAVVRRAAIRASAAPAKGRKAEDKALKKQGREFYNKLVADSDYQGEDYEVFSAWLAGGRK